VSDRGREVDRRPRAIDRSKKSTIGTAATAAVLSDDAVVIPEGPALTRRARPRSRDRRGCACDEARRDDEPGRVDHAVAWLRRQRRVNAIDEVAGHVDVATGGGGPRAVDQLAAADEQAGGGAGG
jgi:hypothetical protein